MIFTKEPVTLICTKDCTLFSYGSALCVDAGQIVVVNLQCEDELVIEYGPFNLFELPVDNFIPECFEVVK